VQNPNVVYDEKEALIRVNILSEDEITAFAATMVQRDVKHERLYALTQPAPTASTTNTAPSRHNWWN